MKIPNGQLNILVFNPFLLLILLFTSCVPKTIESPSPTILATNQSELTSVKILDIDAYEKVINGQFSLISDIQGQGHASPYVRQTFDNVFGVVTVKKADGFYMQSVNPDKKLETSEGIFVFLRNVPKVNIGDWVLVEGEITEFFPGNFEDGNLSITEIEADSIKIISSGNSLPNPVILGTGGRMLPTEVIDDDKKKTFDLNDGLDYFESLESMLVQINDAICVGPSTSFKEFVVLSDGGKNSSGLNQRSGITISESDFNPERIMVDDSLISVPLVDVGDSFKSPIVGVLDYAFGNYRVQPIKKLEIIKGNLVEEKIINSDDGLLTVASLNLENLDANDLPARFDQLGEIIAVNLYSPTIVALQEVQDNNGPMNDSVVDASLTYLKIIESIKKINGTDYQYINIDPIDDKDGGEEGGNIRLGLLLKKNSSIKYVTNMPPDARDAVKILPENNNLILDYNPGRIDPTNYVFGNSRKSIIFQFDYNGNNIFLINNHWSSKGEDTPLYGNSQPPLTLSESKRIGQAKVIGDFVRKILELDPESNIIVLGDFNDFYFSKSLDTLEKSGLNNLIFNLPIYERYTYNYEGNSQNLDNFLISPNLNKNVVGIDIVHINSEFSYKKRFSDHDPIVVTFEMEANR